MKERVPVVEAAKELGVSPESVRQHMKLGIWDLGCVTTPKQTGRSTYGFYIYRHKLDKHLGKGGD